MRPTLALPLLATATLTTSPALAADLWVTGELPAAATATTRIDHGRDELRPLGLALRVNGAYPWRDHAEVFWGPTVRGSRSAIGAPQLQLRLDSGLRWSLGEGERASPFLEASLAFVQSWLYVEGARFQHSGVGPSLGLGARLGEHDRVTVVGARVTADWAFGGETFASYEVHDPAGDWGFGYCPSNLALSLYAGRVF